MKNTKEKFLKAMRVANILAFMVLAFMIVNSIKMHYEIEKRTSVLPVWAGRVVEKPIEVYNEEVSYVERSLKDDFGLILELENDSIELIYKNELVTKDGKIKENLDKETKKEVHQYIKRNFYGIE